MCHSLLHWRPPALIQNLSPGRFTVPVCILSQLVIVLVQIVKISYYIQFPKLVSATTYVCDDTNRRLKLAVVMCCRSFSCLNNRPSTTAENVGSITIPGRLDMQPDQTAPQCTFCITHTHSPRTLSCLQPDQTAPMMHLTLHAHAYSLDSQLCGLGHKTGLTTSELTSELAITLQCTHTNTLLQEQELAITSQCTHKHPFAGARTCNHLTMHSQKLFCRSESSHLHECTHKHPFAGAGARNHITMHSQKLFCRSESSHLHICTHQHPFAGARARNHLTKTHKNSFVGVRAHIYMNALTNTLLQEQEVAITSQCTHKHPSAGAGTHNHLTMRSQTPFCRSRSCAICSYGCLLWCRRN